VSLLQFQRCDTSDLPSTQHMPIDMRGIRFIFQSTSQYFHGKKLVTLQVCKLPLFLFVAIHFALSLRRLGAQQSELDIFWTS
jgi:hypothetical protein